LTISGFKQRSSKLLKFAMDVHEPMASALGGHDGDSLVSAVILADGDANR